MLEATDLERRTLAREFHDGLGQVLTGLQLGLAPILRSVQQGRPVDAASAQFLADAAAEALETCDRVLAGVSPLQPTNGDLLMALRGLPDRLPPDGRDRLTVRIDPGARIALSLERREHLYQIAREAVTNALKHAGSEHIEVAVEARAGQIELVVEDDGVGFEPGYRSGGLGLDSLGLRASALGGRLEISRRDGRGTRVRCVCPQPPPQRVAQDR